MIFSYSYEALKFSDNKFSFESYIENRKKYNFKLNDYVLANISKLKSNKNEKPDQLLIDVVNYFITCHLKERALIFRFSRKLNKSFFIFF